MDSEQRDRLNARKARLGKVLRRRELGEYSRPVMLEMRRRGLKAARKDPAVLRRTLSGLTDGPARDERLDWSFVPHAVRRPWPARTSPANLLARAFADLDVTPRSPVVVVWHPSRAGLRLRAMDLLIVADQALCASPEVWICAAAGGDWLIESSIPDREVCWGRPGCTTMPQARLTV